MSESSEPSEPEAATPTPDAAEPNAEEPDAEEPKAATEPAADEDADVEAPAPDPAESETPPTARRKSPWLLFGAAALALLIAAAITLFVLTRDTDGDDDNQNPPCTSSDPASCATTSRTGSPEPPRDPTAVARAYAEAYSRHDVDALERHVCAGDQPMIQTFRAIKEQFEKNGVTIEVTGTATETGDTATVPTRTTEQTTAAAANVTEGPLSLTKENGVWKVCNLTQTAKPTWSGIDACALLTPQEAGRYLGGGTPAGVRDNTFDRPTCAWKAEDNYHEVRLYLWNPPVREAITGNAKRQFTIAGKPAYVRSEISGGCAIDVDAGQGFVSIDVSAVNAGDQCSPAATTLATVIGRLKW